MGARTGPGASCGSGTAVLISGGETLGVLAAVRALRDAGHEPWVAVFDPRGYAARSRAAAGVVVVPDPARDEVGFVHALADAAGRIPASVVLPGTEVALFALSRHADRFPGGVTLGVCPPAVVEKATDKTLLAALAGAAGLVVPPTFEVRLADLEDAPPLPYPGVVKPVRSDLQGPGGASRHFAAQRVNSPGELRAAVAALPNARGLVQPYLPGPIGSMAGVFWDGEMLGAVQSRADRIWPIHCGSMTYAVTVPLDPRLSAMIGDLLSAIGWNGLFQVDFIEHAGQSFLIDLNPRVYTSLAITTRAGVNLPAIWVDLLRGRRPPGNSSAYPVGVGYRHDEDDIRALAVMLVRGPRRAAVRGLLPRRRTIHAVFSIRDPLPLLTTFGKLIRLVRSGRASGSRG